MNDRTKYVKARERGMQLAYMPDTDMEPDDIKHMKAAKLYEWLEESCNYTWDEKEQRWTYDG
jgi:phosphoribosyl 1,2-cyclic phosphodiesterase